MEKWNLTSYMNIAGLLKRLESSKTGKSLKRPALEYDSYRLSRIEWIRYGIQGIGAAGIVAYTFYRSLAVWLLLLPAGILYPLYKRRDLKEQRLYQLNFEFKEGILILASFLSAGYSLENAFGASARELQMLYEQGSLIADEFSYINSQLRINKPIEQLLLDFSHRSGLDDIRNFAQIFSVAKRSGGELVNIIDHTAGVIRDKVQVKEEIRTMTADKRYEQKIMNAIPFLIVIYIDLTSPGFFGQMYTTVAGRAIMTVCLCIYLAAYQMSARLLTIEI